MSVNGVSRESSAGLPGCAAGAAEVLMATTVLDLFCAPVFSDEEKPELRRPLPADSDLPLPLAPEIEKMKKVFLLIIEVAAGLLWHSHHAGVQSD